jgi:hypothetical protein
LWGLRRLLAAATAARAAAAAVATKAPGKAAASIVVFPETHPCCFLQKNLGPFFIAKMSDSDEDIPEVRFHSASQI